ncbi:MAG: response regulator [Syntrophales bacterium]|nr:response regulator [Syntrophales bacterium]
MTTTSVMDVKIKKDERLKEIYAIAQVVPYEDLDKKVGGNFLMGFSDEPMAILVASAIAENLGLPPIKSFDETAKDILGEFMNTIVGHTITAWDKMGFRVRFQPPTSVRYANIREKAYASDEAYMIILSLSIDHIVFKVTFRNADKQLAGRRIMVVDDSMVIRGIISKALQEAGFTVEQAEDGLVATEKYKKFKPHLTIMDLNMPNLGGLDAIIQIREADPQARFIMLTTSARKDEVVTAKTLNVANYVIKPVQMKDFLPIVRKALE